MPNHRSRVPIALVVLLLWPAASRASTPQSGPIVPHGPEISSLPVIHSLQEMVDRHREPSPDPRRPGGSLDPNSQKEHITVEGGGPGSSTAPPLGWAPHDGAFELDEASHLLRRALVGARFEEIVAARDAGLAVTLDQLMTPAPLPPPPGSWATEPVPNQTGWTQAQKDSLNALYRDRVKTLKGWWVGVIAGSPIGLTETMTLFWHDHFATRAATVTIPQSMYVQNDLLRRHALGNFKTLTRQICTDPAMLNFLDGDRNRKGNPNENFARELLELFTMGEGSGYTQGDVGETARACTGWQTDGVTSYFTASRFDGNPKTILGQTGNWGMDDVVDILFEQPATARHLCAKLYRWFLDEDAQPADVEALAQILRNADYEVAPVVRTILASKAFFSDDFRGSILTDGADVFAGQLRRFHLTGFDPLSSAAQRTYLLNQMSAYGQILFDPPDVAGWPGHRNWINSNTLPNRRSYSVQLVDGTGGIGLQIDVVGETARLTNPEDAHQLIDDLALLTFGVPPTEEIQQAMLDELLQGAEPYDWSLALPDAPQRLRDLYRYTMRLPDYQLK